MPRSAWITLVCCVLVPVAAATAAAQGALSTQGFGYPTGQLSTRALATGGGVAEFDPDSPLNPAAIAASSDPRVFAQYEPEFRRFSLGDASNSTITARFPVTSASVPLGSKGSLGLSVSSFLDRSSETTVSRDVTIAGQTATISENLRVVGAINDARLALGWSPGTRIQVGVGGHVFVGQNRVVFSQSFPDTLTEFTPVSQTSTLGFTGFGVSAGAILRASKVFVLGVSGRKGGTLETRAGDTTVSEARIPDRFGASVSYEGIPGASLSAHVARDQWSSLNGLGSDAATAVDAWEGGLGIEAVGPRIAERQLVLRAGARYRTLPFQAAGGDVKELSFAGGLGAQFFRNRAAFDFTLEHARRSTDITVVSAARERAFILSFGLRVRP